MVSKKQYLKAKSTVEKYRKEQGEIAAQKIAKKILNQTQKIANRDKKLINKAKKIFPIGTKFVSHFGAHDEVTHKHKDKPLYYVEGQGDVIVQGRREERLIYHSGIKEWAKILKS